MSIIANAASRLENLFYKKPNPKRLRQIELGDCLQTALSDAAKPKNKLKINPPINDKIDETGNYTITLTDKTGEIIQININMRYPNSEIYVIYAQNAQEPSSETYSASQFLAVKRKLVEFVSNYK